MLVSKKAPTILFSLAFLLLAACGEAPKNVAEVKGTGIVDGTEVSPTEPLHRKVLSLKSKYTLTDAEGTPTIQYSQCSASAIGPRIILTAAHCVFENTEVQWVEFTDSTGLKQFVVREARQHELYKVDVVNDIAILILEEALPPEITILELATAEDKLPDLIQAAGFGRSDGRVNSTNPGTGVLRKKVLRVSKTKVDPKFFTIDQEDGGACQGDSGGPALVTIGDREIVYGVAARTSSVPSTEPDRDLCRNRAEYTFVVEYLDFINSTTAELLEKYPI